MNSELDFLSTSVERIIGYELYEFESILLNDSIIVTSNKAY